MLHFSNESSFQQLVNLFPDNLLPVRVKTSNPLSDGPCCWQDVKPMSGDGEMNSLHIRVRPCENVMALSEGVLDVPGLFWRQEGTDIRKVSSFFQNLDHLQGIRYRGIFVRRTR